MHYVYAKIEKQPSFSDLSAPKPPMECPLKFVCREALKKPCGERRDPFGDLAEQEVYRALYGEDSGVDLLDLPDEEYIEIFEKRRHYAMTFISQVVLPVGVKVIKCNEQHEGSCGLHEQIMAAEGAEQCEPTEVEIERLAKYGIYIPAKPKTA